MSAPIAGLPLAAGEARRRATALSHRFEAADLTHREWLIDPYTPTPAILQTVHRIETLRYLVWGYISRPEIGSDALFLLADVLRGMTDPEFQFDARTTASLRLLASLVADEAATRPPAALVAT